MSVVEKQSQRLRELELEKSIDIQSAPPMSLFFSDVRQDKREKPTIKLPQPPRFAGRSSESVNDWLQKVELYFAAHRVSEAEAVAYAVQPLDDIAAKWWRVMHNGPLAEEIRSSWSTFRVHIVRQFLPPNAEAHARARINRLQQSKSVFEYVAKFQALLVEIPSMTDQEALERFMSGLKPVIRTHVCLSRPATLASAISNALIVDDCATMSTQRLKPSISTPSKILSLHRRK